MEAETAAGREIASRFIFYFFMAVLGLRCCAQAFPSCSAEVSVVGARTLEHTGSLAVVLWLPYLQHLGLAATLNVGC